MINKAILDNFQQKLKAARTTETLAVVLEAGLKAKGIYYYTFHYYDGHPRTGTPLKYNTCAKMLCSWQAYFNENHGDLFDTTLLTVYDSYLPYYWQIKEQLKHARSETEYVMREKLKHLKLIDAYTFPVHGPYEAFSTLTVYRHQTQVAMLDLPGQQFELLLMAQLYSHYIHKCLLKETSEVQALHLKPREMQCLQLIARNLSVKHIAQKLCITERTVNFHIQNLNKKLGTRNKYESLRRAEMLGLMKN